jgi:CRISPR-associated protein Csx10
MYIKYRLLLLSDWHIGSGTGIPGIVDNGVLKNSQNLPIINGKTIKGLTRDALGDLLGLMGESAPWHLEEEIFGKQGDKEGQAIFYNPVICTEASQRGSKEYKHFLNYFQERSLGEIRCHTSIDNRTGVAKKGHLFSEETSELGFEFFGSIRTAEKYAGYLIAALRFITKIGGKRRRGLGQCQFDILFPSDYTTRIEELFP